MLNKLLPIFKLGAGGVIGNGRQYLPWISRTDAIRALSWAALGFQTVVVTFASYLVWFWLVRHYPATRISAFTLLTPVFGLLAGVVLLDEPVTARLVLALAAVSCGIALVNRLGRQPGRVHLPTRRLSR